MVGDFFIYSLSKKEKGMASHDVNTTRTVSSRMYVCEGSESECGKKRWWQKNLAVVAELETVVVIAQSSYQLFIYVQFQAGLSFWSGKGDDEGYMVQNYTLVLIPHERKDFLE